MRNQDTAPGKSCRTETRHALIVLALASACFLYPSGNPFTASAFPTDPSSAETLRDRHRTYEAAHVDELSRAKRKARLVAEEAAAEVEHPGTEYFILVWKFGTTAPTVKNTAVQLLVDQGSGRTASASGKAVRIPLQLAPATKVSSNGCSDIIVDGSFENGGIPSTTWDPETSTNFGTPKCTFPTCGSGAGTVGPRTGDVWAWFGGAFAVETSTLGQTVTIDPCKLADLTFYLRIGAVTAPFTDVLNVRVDGNIIESFVEPAVAEADFSLRTVSLDAFADGAPHLILFEYIGPTTGVGNFSVDDVALVVCIDTEPPTITCPPNQSVDASPYATSAVVTYPAPMVSDNCAGVGVPNCDPPSGFSFPIGTTTVTCTVEDPAGNTATCSFTVTVAYVLTITNYNTEECANIRTTSTTGTVDGNYCWKQSDGTEIQGPSEVAFSGSRATFKSAPADPNYILGGVDRGRRRAQARLTLLQMMPRQTRSINDTDTSDSICMCP